MSLNQKTVSESTSTSESAFSTEDIYEQLDRIFLNQAFKKSDILRHFLSFIVAETIKGHSAWVKEYTIAVNVLHKPADFNPQDNCIVRIHAGRLRRALNRYYNESGANDPLRISIPKGGYVPVFQESNKTSAGILTTDENIHGKPDAIAVIPFNHFQHNALEDSFADGLGLQLSSALLHTGYFTVTAYHITRSLLDNTSNIGEITQLIKAKYLITGDIQSSGTHYRIFIQLIQTATNKQVWSQEYDKQLDAENIFDMQDEIVGLIIPELKAFFNPKKNEVQTEWMTAIA